jgi:hypothetical protein
VSLLVSSGEHARSLTCMIQHANVSARDAGSKAWHAQKRSACIRKNSPSERHARSRAREGLAAEDQVAQRIDRGLRSSTPTRRQSKWSAQPVRRRSSWEEARARVESTVAAQAAAMLEGEGGRGRGEVNKVEAGRPDELGAHGGLQP